MKVFLNYLFLFLFITSFNAQSLKVPLVSQEQNQWCWAGVSKSVLGYYGIQKTQCEIADYTRQVATWHNYGKTNCCSNTNAGCNYWNYLFGNPGSIEDILLHFGDIQNYHYNNPITLSTVNTEISNARPFIARWIWSDGSGHFVVGHGVNENNVSYMNPWPGEGYHISTYAWLVNDGNHKWTHTELMTTSLSTNEFTLKNEELSIFPNPIKNIMNISSVNNINTLSIFNLLGQEILSKSINDISAKIDISDLKSGTYIVKISSNNLINTIKVIKD